MNTTWRAWRALVTFHASGGARAALRTGTIGVALVIFVVGSSPDPVFTVMRMAAALVARGAPADVARGDIESAEARLLLAAFAAALGAIGARRVTLGATGWLRSLPASGVTARRAAWAAVCFAAVPAAVVALAAVVLVGARVVGTHVALAPAKVAGLPVLLAAAGALVLRVDRPAARGLAGAAVVGAAWGTWPALLAAVVLLAGWDRSAAGLAGPPLRASAAGRSVRRAPNAWRGSPWHSRWGSRWGALPPRGAALAMGVRWAWRVAGWRTLVDGVVLAALPVAFAALVRANNPELAAATRARVARLGVGLGVVGCVACAAAALLARRAPWPWARTLPWSATERVLVDVVALAIPAFGVGAVGAVVLVQLAAGAHAVGDALAAVAMAAVVAVIAALVAAGALRAGAGRQTGAVGELAVVAVPAAVAFALRPALAIAAPLLALALGALAVRRERRALGAVRWNELRHDVAGDVGWIARV